MKERNTKNVEKGKQHERKNERMYQVFFRFYTADSAEERCKE